MTRPLYQDAAHEAKPTSGDWHKGLWYERFVDIYVQDGSEWSIPKPVDGNSPKSIWIEKVTGPTGNTKELERHALNLLGRVAWLKGELGVFKSDWNFVTGLGNPHPVENGFLWHPTLGVPYLPGSSVKGLLRAWVEHWDDTLTPDIKKARCLTWFGTEAKEDIPDQTGRLIFFDALPVKEVTLAQDVMTPHYGDWYEQGGEIGNAKAEHNKVPADWHSPVPVPFLVVKDASWLFAIAPRKPEDQAEAKNAMEQLKQALEWLGAGAKTAVGYGRMLEDKGKLSELISKRDAEESKRQKAQADKLKTPLDREMDEAIKLPKYKGQEAFKALIQEIDQGRWKEKTEDRVEVLRRIKEMMQAQKGQWKESSLQADPNKDKEHQRTLKVMKWLKESEPKPD